MNIDNIVTFIAYAYSINKQKIKMRIEINNPDKQRFHSTNPFMSNYCTTNLILIIQHFRIDYND